MWHWKDWCGNLYTEYVKKFVKGKYEASGFPSEVRTDDQKREYCGRVGAKLGFLLNPDDVKYNAARRTLSKLLMNVTWGKLGQRVDLSRTEYLSGREVDNLFSDTTRVIRLFELTEGVDLYKVIHSPRAETIYCNKFGAVHHAAMTTAYARVLMYPILERAMEKGELIYTDTDSVAYSFNRSAGDPLKHLVTDEFGELSNDIKGGMEVRETIVAGPKNYSMLLVHPETGETDSKKAHRGVIMHATTQLKLGHVEFRQAVVNRDTPSEITVSDVQIMRKGLGTVYTTKREKKIKFSSEKKLNDGVQCTPYGFIPL